MKTRTALNISINILILILNLSLLFGHPPLAWANSLTPQKEREIGQHFHLKVAASGAIVDDPILTKTFKGITDRVLKGANLNPDQYNFYILNSDGINAFAVPGGYIYVHTETINSLENEGQLASVLSHETAHLTSRHFARRAESASSTTIASIASMLAGILIATQGGSTGALGQAMMMGGAGAGAQSMLANSREDESEADAKGRQYLTRAGYAARDMYGAFKVMSSKTYQASRNIPTYLTTHPALTSRMATFFSEAEKTATAPPDPAYQAFKDRVLAVSGEVSRVQNIFTKRLVGQRDPSALHGLGILAQRQQKLTLANKLMREALSLTPNNQEYLADLGDLALLRHQPAEARDFYQKAGSNRLAIFGLARASELLGDHTHAAILYEQAVNITPYDFPRALEMAGRFFGQNGRPGQGHYYLGRYFAATGNIDKAIFHYQQAAADPGSGQFKTLAAHEEKTLTNLKNNKD
ncbi:MAG: hypothetical protein AMR96_00560 [Candidatus Adiutrix intracellularis]|nr:MAG: hypothetical protein AMR96_00560 [Candidatus Adiutrix intracellularis]